VCKKSLST